MTFKEFKHLNPRRDGNNNKSLCFVCGDKVDSGVVYCSKHRHNSWPTWGSTEWMDLLLAHPDFNGYIISNKCAQCDGSVISTIENTDYLCSTCRNSAGSPC